MPTFVEAMTGFMKDNFCAALGVLGDAITLGSQITVGPIGAVNVPNALSALVCDEPPDRLPPIDPPFEGGQCDGVCYQVSVTNGEGSNETFQTRGPIGGVRTVTIPGGGQLEVFSRSSVNFPDSTTCFALSGAGWRGTGIGGTSWNADRTATITSIAVTGGGDPQACGDPPAVVPPPGDTYEFGDDVTYNIDDSTEITVPVTAIFSPIFVSFDGSLRIPVNIDVGGLEFNGTLEVAPNFNLEIKPTKIVAGPGRPDDTDPSGGQPQVEVPEDVEDFDAIVGVLVFSQFDGDENNASGYPSVGGPNFLVPRIGSVQFAIKTGNSIGWTADQDVKNLESYVPCLAPQGAIAVRVTPEPGFTRRFTPVRGKPLTAFS